MNINVFISHSWKYSNHYDKLCEWIFQTQWNANGTQINFINYSVPKDDPIHYAPTDRELIDAIYLKIYSSHVVLIPVGMYVNFSKWIQKEIDGARIYRRPILAVDPWGQERKASVAVEAANKSVGWRSESVVKGIWELYNYGRG